MFGVVQCITLRINMRMLCKQLEFWQRCIIYKRQIPQLDTIISFITNEKSIVLFFSLRVVLKLDCWSKTIKFQVRLYQEIFVIRLLLN